MFSLDSKRDSRKITVCSLVTCIYLPIIITIISYQGLLYTIGKRSSFYLLILIFLAEFLKVLYLNNVNSDGLQSKKTKYTKNKPSETLKIFLSVIGIVFVYFIGIILFGAPVVEYHEETLMLSILLTLLTIFPLVSYAGINLSVQVLFGMKSYNEDPVLQMFVMNILLTICGTWFGATVIPLDWDKPWQKWPIPCYLGAIGGYILSNIMTILKGLILSAASKYPLINSVSRIIFRNVK